MTTSEGQGLSESSSVVLRDERAGSRVVIAPCRGGMVTRFEVGGRELLYLDEETFTDPSKNVRGGVPVLFPSPGPLAEGRFTYEGRAGQMPQHGIVRQRAWTVLEAGPAEATLECAADEASRRAFPWRFALTIAYSLVGTRLRIAQRVANHDDAPMPFAIGFHPYFAVPEADKASAAVRAEATRAWDNVARRVVPVTGHIDLTSNEVDLHLLDHRPGRLALDLPDGARIEVAGAPDFRRWVIWTLRGRDFVCVEPWTAGADALNTREDLLVVAPAETRELVTEIAFVQNR